MTEQDFYLDGWLVEVARGRITRGEATVRLEPQIMKVLAFLAANHNEVVTKEHMMRSLWGNAFVGDAALTRCIFEIRQAFGDSPKQPKIVETVPKIGYRLIASLAPPHASRRKPLWATFGVAAATALLAMGFLLAAQPTAVRELQMSPTHFDEKAAANITAQTAVIADVFDRALYGALVDHSDVEIRYLDDRYESKGSKEDSRAGDDRLEGKMLARPFGIAYQVTVYAVINDEAVWEKTYDIEDNDVFTVQADLIAELSAELGFVSTPAPDDPAMTKNALAYAAYQKGVTHFSRFTFPHNENAVALFEKAVEHDPAFGLAYARLATALVHKATTYNSGRMEDARTAADKAMELAPNESRTHNAIGLIRSSDGDTQGAIAAFEQAVAMDSSNWEAAFNGATTYLRDVQFDRAEPLFLQTLEHYPNHIIAMEHLGFLYIRIGDTESAKHWLDRAMAQAPQAIYASSQMATLEMLAGNTSAAIENCERVRSYAPTHQACLNVLGVSNLLSGNIDDARDWFEYAADNLSRSQYAHLGRAQVFLAAGETERGIELVDAVLDYATTNLASYDDTWQEYWIIAACYALKNDATNAFTWLDMAAERGRRFYLWDSTDPIFANLRGDPRFDEYISATMSASR